MRKRLPRVLVIDDEPDLRELVELTLIKMGLEVTTAGCVADAKTRLAEHEFDLALTDMRLSDGEGLEVVRHIVDAGLDVPVAVITAYGSAENAVAAMKAGAFDYLAKPVGLADLRSLVRSALSLGDPVAAAGHADGLVGEAPAMQEVKALIFKIAKSQAAVTIEGESGTGKERAARLIHAQGPRAAGPFVPVNCGAIPDTLVEAEFFGYKKGAFTGADADRDGFFQGADGGTLFLDEVGDLPLVMQVKLLRAIQEKKVRRLGNHGEEPVDVRIVCASHKKLNELVDAGQFRQDLYYRLNVIALKMPPLRELREDVPKLIGHLLERFAAGGEKPRLAPAAVQALLAYHYPGNVRELENILERAVALSGGALIEPIDLQLTPASIDPDAAPALASGEALQDYLDRVEREAILKALDATRYNRTQAAKNLGVSFRSLRYRLERLGIK
ncbi:sigma-54-dependent transcriptional regulator [Crenobacter cavernae]|uniref:Sigma-54-dependent Fis family transcriptional regulator n=1 Tax=Crenobacter cavernae TaxID=2290923 RepID=A0ABY0FEW4_9NEIS|nr:sigma-54 dependent transcriptional regulator [Crenobacter cavernae]RXZ43828.1 sigma-54-dependent Fis family transcriptional regulator [Crenobacter cavernae]